MAAPRSRSPDHDSDSSSGDEERKRLMEAAWHPPGIEKRVEDQRNPTAPAIPSLRARPDNHEHDGNELQTTPEFRTHVAKKLAAMLDSCIKEIPRSSSLIEPESKSESEDEGFRLFCTSVPGDTGTVISTISKRRPRCSTSEDSEEEIERRCREAAVSGLDILRHSAVHPIPVQTSNTPDKDKKCKKKKKKKKKSKDKEQGELTDCQEVRQEPESSGLKKKKRKKDKQLDDETRSDHQTLRQEQEHSDFKKDKHLSDGAESQHQDLRQDHKSNGFKKKKV